MINVCSTQNADVSGNRNKQLCHMDCKTIQVVTAGSSVRGRGRVPPTSRFRAKFNMSASVKADCFSCLASAAGALSANMPTRANTQTACAYSRHKSAPGWIACRSASVRKNRKHAGYYST